MTSISLYTFCHRLTAIALWMKALKCLSVFELGETWRLPGDLPARAHGQKATCKLQFPLFPGEVGAQTGQHSGPAFLKAFGVTQPLGASLKGFKV